MPKIKVSRRTFLKTSADAVAAAGFPAIVPSSVFGQMAPSNRINIGAIGNGRISRGHDMPGIWQFDHARIMAVFTTTTRPMKCCRARNAHRTGSARASFDSSVNRAVNKAWVNEAETKLGCPSFRSLIAKGWDTTNVPLDRMQPSRNTLTVYLTISVRLIVRVSPALVAETTMG